MKLFSIIIPAYNAEKFIEECIESITKQNFKDYEVIIVDDKSRDKTKEILKKYADMPDIKIIFNDTNQKAGGTRNKGLENASGQYILFLDADDKLDKPDVLVKLSKIIQINNEPDVIYMGFKDSKNTHIPNEKADIINRLEEWDYPNVWSTLWKKEFINKHNIRFEANRYYEDFIFYYRGVLNSQTYGVAPFVTHIYRDDNLSMTRHDDIYKVRDHCYMTLQALELVEQVDEKYRQALLKRIERNSYWVWKGIQNLYKK